MMRIANFNLFFIMKNLGFVEGVLLEVELDGVGVPPIPTPAQVGQYQAPRGTSPRTGVRQVVW